MATPGGCADIPAASISGGSGATAYANANFTPASCTGTDSLQKTWRDDSINNYDIPTLTNAGSGMTDDKYGSANTAIIAAITAASEGGYHAAARYCDKLVLGGYSDWYLPNRTELNLLYVNRASIPGLNISTQKYFSSTEASQGGAWDQEMSGGSVSAPGNKNNPYLIRCVRRF